MKITDIELGMLRVPLKTPFKTALRTVDTVEDIVVLVRTDTGHTGYGEAPATAVITGDTHGSIVEAITPPGSTRACPGPWDGRGRPPWPGRKKCWRWRTSGSCGNTGLLGFLFIPYPLVQY